MRYRLSTFRVQLEVAEPPSGIAKTSAAAVPILRAIYAGLDADQEHFTALAMDGQLRVIWYKVIFTGGMNSATVDPRVVFRTALMLGAASIIVAHNHPAGDPNPSAEDRLVTRRLILAGDVLGIAVNDHIVLGEGDKWASAR